jgi:cytochrome c oxidase assembly factor CtaG
MTWWCSATGRPWTWAWQWYPGVHLLVLALALAWWILGRRQQWPSRPWGWFAPGLFFFLATLDWPIGKLGAGYLASVHTGQFLLLTLLVAPCLLKAIPPSGWLHLAPTDSRSWRTLRYLARPLPALVGYDLIVVASHFPGVVDAAMTTQAGSFAIDLSWLLAGLFLWWPIVAPRPFVRMGVFGTIGFIFAATVVPTVPAMMMVFSDWPIYQLYELAPRVWPHFTANEDLKLAGLSMKLIGDIPLWIAAAVVFFRGTRDDGQLVDG